MNKSVLINKIIAEYGENLSRQKVNIDIALKKARAFPEFASLEKEIAAAEIEIAKAEADGKNCIAENGRLETLCKKKEKFL